MELADLGACGDFTSEHVHVRGKLEVFDESVCHSEADGLHGVSFAQNEIAHF